MKKVHFIGICGVGMSGVAKILKDLGWEVSGSDDGFYPPISDHLAEYGIAITRGYAKRNIPHDVDIIVIGKNAKLIPEENEEVRAAFASGAPVRSFAEVLHDITNDAENIVVVGSWGKSTCTALLAWCLERASKNPSYFIGALPHGLESHAKLGKGTTFVLEGDEYPASNWDDTSKFLYYHPRDILLTSAEHDHVNVFPTHADYLLPFHELLSLVPKDGIIVACSDDPSAKILMTGHRMSSHYVAYGLHEKAGWTASNIQYGETTTFDLINKNKTVTALSTTLLGQHNIQNIVGVSALLLEKNMMTPAELAEGIRTFRGIIRRLDLKTDASSVRVYEGFGSSYRKARGAIEAMKLHFPNRRLVVVFEPHTFSWRNRDTIHWYDDVFAGSGAVYIYEPAAQGAKTHSQLSQEEIVERVRRAGYNVAPISSEQDGLVLLKKQLRESDVVLLLTSGNLGGLIASIPKLVEKIFPK